MSAWSTSGKVESEERDLVACCLRGDPEAWNHLFNLHHGATARFIFQLGPRLTREDVEEICQEAFLAVVRGLASFSGRCRLQTWIFRIAANKARDFRERRDAAKRGGGQQPISMQQEDPASGLTLDLPSTAPGPDAELLRAEGFRELRQALDSLGGPCQEIIELRYFAELSYEEIGASLKLNLKTVSSRLSKCLDKLETLVRELAEREGGATLPV